MKEHIETHDDHLHTPGVAHETRDISTRVVVVFGITLIVAAIVIHFGVWLLYMFYGSLQARADTRQFPMAQVGAPPLPPAPRLQTQPREDLKNLRAEEQRQLDSYGWVDASRGTVRIPIDRAMQLVLEQGLPARQQPEGAQPGGMPERSSSGRTITPFQRY